MSRLIQALASDKMQLFVSLPYNDPELAKVALAEGADGLKVHINVRHLASGNNFKGLDFYVDEFKQIRAMFDGPLGIVPGGDSTLVDSAEVVELEQMGFDFLSIFAHHMPLFLMKNKGLAATFATDYRFDIDLLELVKSFPPVALEASIIPPEEYGRPLTFYDVLRYRSLVVRSGLPVIVPTQRRIFPEDIPVLESCGVKAILIGAMVTGTDCEGIKKSVASFRNAIDRL